MVDQWGVRILGEFFTLYSNIHYSSIPREGFMIPKRILIVDDEENFRHLLSVY